MKIGDRVYVHGYVDEILKDTVTIRNAGGYFRTVKSEIIEAEHVRHGKFIGTEYDGFADGNPVYYEWKCSECGCIFEDDEPTYRYCPNCGARMNEK